MAPVLLAGAALAGTPGTGQAAAPPPAVSPLAVSPIAAAFVPTEFATHFTVKATEPGATLTYRWTLSLQLVDAKGAADPSQPGAAAALDPRCDNRGVTSSSATTFVWHHGGQDGCDHGKMGPSGHEGLVTVAVSDGRWSCTATYKGSNTGTGTAARCVKAAPPAPAGYACTGPQVKLLDTSNVYGVVDGAKAPGFATKGKPYCLVSITTYHWNGGKGATPGALGLSGSTRVGPVKATGSAGQGGAPNVNWSATFSTAKPTVIDGAYACTDSDPASWSQNQQSGGKGFCVVYGVAAVKQPGGSRTPPAKPGKPAKPARSARPAKPGKPAKPTTPAQGGRGKLSIAASPQSGNPPLAVTFALRSPRAVQWRVDFGDGQSRVAIGNPPATITHTYARAGDYRPRLTVLTSPNASAAASATTSVQVGTSLMQFTVSPSSGGPPLRAAFTLGTSVRNITTWTVDFGDGQRTGGSGKPPASVTHTYAKAGTYLATFAVKPGAYALVAAFAQVVVGGGTPPALSLGVAPASGRHPLAVTFTLGSNIPGTIVSWQLVFGDGARSGGAGKPPATVTHTYAKAGTYLAYLVVAQQQRYGGVQFVVPRNGLAISVR